MYISNMAQDIALIIELVIVGIGFLWLVSFLIWNNIFGNDFSIKKINDLSFKEFFVSLNKKHRQEFVRWFVYEPGKKTGLKRSLFVNNENNAPFFKDYVRFSSFYKDKISIELMYKMFEFAKASYYDQTSYDYINNKEIRLFYSLRHNSQAAKYCKVLCYEKLEDFSELEKNNTFLKYLVTLESMDNIQNAIELCKKAIDHNISDGTKGGFEFRLKRLQKKAAFLQKHNKSLVSTKTAE